MGFPITVIVDDYLPIKKQSDGSVASIFSKQSADGDVWMMLLEKAFAKLMGNYELTNGGWPTEGVNALNGAPS